MAKRKKIVPQFGDRVEVKALDHATRNQEGWQSKKQMLSEEHLLPMTIVGFYIGCEGNQTVIALAKCQDDYCSQFYISTSTIQSIEILKKNATTKNPR